MHIIYNNIIYLERYILSILVTQFNTKDEPYIWSNNSDFNNFMSNYFDICEKEKQAPTF